jgi:YesN/AraC family two-component response regulator
MYSEPERIAGIIRDAFVQIASGVNEQKRSHNSGLKDRILAYIAAHYEDPQMCVVMIAGQFNLSESYFSQFFKMQTGEVFSNYLEKLRIDRRGKSWKETARSISSRSASLWGTTTATRSAGHSSA